MSKSAKYVVIIERGPEGFGAFFPDFPGCVSAGDTVEDTILGAKEALCAHVALMMQDGEVIPAPTPLELIPEDPEVDEAVRVLISVA